MPPRARPELLEELVDQLGQALRALEAYCQIAQPEDTPLASETFLVRLINGRWELAPVALGVQTEMLGAADSGGLGFRALVVPN